jgi:hypothetical protein
MDAAKSQTEFIVRFDDGRAEHTCCLHCVFLLQSFMKDRKVAGISTRDYSTGELADARRASYVEGSRLVPKGSMAPFLLGFAERKTAAVHVARFGGRLVDFAGAMGLVERFDKESGAQ